MKEGVEDYYRHKADDISNSSKAKILVNNEVVERGWKDIHVGDLLYVEKDEVKWNI